MKKVLVVCAIMFSLLGFSQNDFREGYIITKSNDTIIGELSVRNDKTLAKTCYFKKNESAKKYHPFDIIGFRFKDSRFFISRNIEDTPVFLEVLIKGKLNMYYYMDAKSQQRYFVENEKGVFKELTYNESTVFKEGSYHSKQSTDHIGMLNYFTADVPSLKSSIEGIKKPNAKSLIKIGEEYHNAVCDDEKCIIYKGKDRSNRIFAELVAGVTSYKNINGQDLLVNKNSFTLGVLAHILIPTLGDRWYLKIGVLRSQEEFYTSTRKTSKARKQALEGFSFPVHAEYMYNKGVVRPRISYGPNLSRHTNISVVPGVNIMLTESLFLSLNSDFRFNDTLFILPSNDLQSISYYGGVSYRF